MANNTAEAAAFLRHQHEIGSTAWRGLCLKLQREARGLEAVYPSALAAALATPESERVRWIADLRRGMVAYSDDPNDSNPYGHIYFIAGWKPGVTPSQANADSLLTWSNDAGVSGGVSLVPITYYRTNWGDNFQFGATWLNRYDFSEFNEAPKPIEPTLGETYHHAIEDVRKAIHFHRGKGHDRIVVALEKDLARMKKKFEKFS